VYFVLRDKKVVGVFVRFRAPLQHRCTCVLDSDRPNFELMDLLLTA
jgi:hypothetical protein